jgi:hypothetical protein
VRGTHQPAEDHTEEQPAARAAAFADPGRLAERLLVTREEDDRLLAARLVAARRPGQWVSAAAALVLFAIHLFTGILAAFVGLTVAAAGKKPWTKWGISGTEITRSVLNPSTTF